MYNCILELKSFHYSLIEKNQLLISAFLKQFDSLSFSTGAFILPKKSKKFVVLRSPFVHKKTQEHFEISNYKLLIKIQSSNLEILTLLLNYIQKTLFLNLELKILKDYSYKIK